jgi:hypothetical protein
MKTKTCIICFADFDTSYHQQKTCGKAECIKQNILCKNNESYKRRSIRNQKTYEKRHCIICGNEFVLKNSRYVTCGLPECFKKNRSETMSKWHKRPPLDEIKIIKEIVDAKCPGCGKMHKYEFIPAWIGNGTPRIGCINYPHCARERFEFDGDPTSLSTIFESDNRAAYI